MTKKQQRAFINFTKTTLKSVKENVRGAFIDKDNRLCATDRIIAIRLFTNNITDCPLLKMQQSQVDLTWFFDEKQYTQQISIDLQYILEQHKLYKDSKGSYPTIQNNGVHIVAYGKNKRIAFNVAYLKRLHDILDFSKDCEFYVTEGKTESHNPMLIKSDVGEAIVMPIRIPK